MRMNGNCAGGTGAFIDQMAAILNVTTNDLNTMAQRAETVYPLPRGVECSPKPIFRI